jgi:hypothetical protein
MAGVLGVPINYFFDAHDGSGLISGDEQDRPDPSPFADRETIELMMAFGRIQSSDVRRAILDLTRAAASLEPATAEAGLKS